jgi:O-antigen ligase
VLVVAAAVAAAIAVLLTGAGGTQTTSYRSGTSTLTLNGRTSAWKAALGPPVDWPFGRGVGEVGTAAYRAHYTLTSSQSSGKLPSTARAVDSGYLATIADVGLVGLAVLLFLLARLTALARGAIRRGGSAGWLAGGLLAVLMLDAVTRSSFTGFPTAFLGLLLVGLCLAAASEDGDGRPASDATRTRSKRPLGRLATQQ